MTWRHAENLTHGPAYGLWQVGRSLLWKLTASKHIWQKWAPKIRVSNSWPNHEIFDIAGSTLNSVVIYIMIIIYPNSEPEHRNILKTSISSHRLLYIRNISTYNFCMYYSTIIVKKDTYKYNISAHVCLTLYVFIDICVVSGTVLLQQEIPVITEM